MYPWPLMPPFGTDSRGRRRRRRSSSDSRSRERTRDRSRGRRGSRRTERSRGSTPPRRETAPPPMPPPPALPMASPGHVWQQVPVMQQPALIGPGGNVQETPSSWRDSWKSQSQWKKPQRPWNKWQSENWKKSKPQDRPAASYDVKEATPEEIKAAEARKAAADKAGQEELSLEDEEADDGEYLKALWESANTAAWAATDRPLSARELVEKGQLEQKTSPKTILQHCTASRCTYVCHLS